MQYHRKLTILFLLLLARIGFSQNTSVSSTEIMTLSRAIEIATDSSLTAFRVKNMYLSGYWQYRSFKADRLPALSLNTNPLQYNRNFVKRYDSQNNVDIYKSQQSLYSFAGLSLRQNVDITGGTFYIDTELGFLRNFSQDVQNQFTTVPFRIGYSQSIFGFNSFKWEKRIEPIRFEKVKKELIYNLEDISELTTEYFFNQLLSQTMYEMAKRNVLNSDTLYQIGLERHSIGSISQAELLTLKLDVLNTKNELTYAETTLKRSSYALAMFLRYNEHTTFQLKLPDVLLDIYVGTEEALRRAKENNPKIPELAEQLLIARQEVERTDRNSRFSASISASVGFNQVAKTLRQVYRDPLQQDLIALSLNVPLIDWGVRKGRVNMARNNLNTVSISVKQAEQAFEQEIIMTVNDFNIQQSLIKSAQEAGKIAELAYNETRQRFLIGKIDVNGLNIALNRKIEAQRGYINALKNYWQSYYKIRKLTLYDFITQRPIIIDFERVQCN